MAGFAAGFVVWAISGALRSGAFEALIYENLSAAGRSSRYPAVAGRIQAAEIVSVLVATASAAPLLMWGGYTLVAVVSVGVVATGIGWALLLPSPPRPRTDVATNDDTDDTEDDEDERSYAAIVRAGLLEALGNRVVRGRVLVSAGMLAAFTIEEYWTLLAREGGASDVAAPALAALVALGQVVGGLSVVRTGQWSGRTIGRMVVLAGIVLVFGTAVVAGLPGLTGAAGPAGAPVVGFLLLAAGYGAIHNAAVVVEARLQDAMSGAARATVTSTSSLIGEVMSTAVYLGFAIGVDPTSYAVCVAAGCALLMPLGAAVARVLGTDR